MEGKRGLEKMGRELDQAGQGLSSRSWAWYLRSRSEVLLAINIVPRTGAPPCGHNQLAALNQKRGHQIKGQDLQGVRK